MGIKIKNLPDFTGTPATGDYFAVTDESVTSKLDYALLAQAIIENYSGSTLAGSAQSVQDAISALKTALTSAQGSITSLQSATTGVSTADVSYTASFDNYSTGGNPHFVKFGRVCMVYGTAKPHATIQGSNDTVEMFSCPTGYAPVGRVLVLQQGSGNRIWLLTLQNGKGYFSRLRNGDTAFDAGTSEWLPFNAVYITAAT